MKNRKIKIAAVLLAAAMAVAMFAGCSKQEQPAGSTEEESLTQEEKKAETLNVGIYNGSYLAVSVLVAREMGYFEQEGLEINWENVSGDGTAMVATGDLDIYTSGVNSVLTSVAAGETGVYIASGLMSEGCDYVAQKDFKLDELKSAKDFEGLSIAACASDPGLLWTKDYLQKAGVEAEFVEFGSISESLSAVQKGECEIGIICGASSYEALLSGNCKVLAQVVDFIGTFPCCRVQVSEKLVHENSEQLVKFMRAQLRGYETYRNEPEKVGEILSEISGQDASICIAKMYDSDAYDTPMTVGIDPDTDAIIASYQKLKDIGIIDADTKYNIEDNLYIDAYGTALKQLQQEEPDNQLWIELEERFEKNNSQLLAAKQAGENE